MVFLWEDAFSVCRKMLKSVCALWGGTGRVGRCRGQQFTAWVAEAAQSDEAQGGGGAHLFKQVFLEGARKQHLCVLRVRISDCTAGDWKKGCDSRVRKFLEATVPGDQQAGWCVLGVVPDPGVMVHNARNTEPRSSVLTESSSYYPRAKHLPSL